LTYSKSAEKYVWKDDTAIPGTRFEYGKRPLKRNCGADWEAVRTSALEGRFEDIPADIYVRYYSSLCRIRSDNLQPRPIIRVTTVYWGSTGVGKSKRAWEEAGSAAYSKDPRSKFWFGYKQQPNVIIDEFRGGIDVAHILRWLDRYPVTVELKGSSTPLYAQNFWITSNLHPQDWYPDLDAETKAALIRRLNIIKISTFP